MWHFREIVAWWQSAIIKERLSINCSRTLDELPHNNTHKHSATFHLRWAHPNEGRQCYQCNMGQPLWQSWLKHPTNDQKIMGSNPGWICHNGSFAQVHFHCPFIPKKSKMIWWGQWGHCQLISSVHQWSARLYAPWGVAIESWMTRPNDLYQYHWM